MARRSRPIKEGDGTTTGSVPVGHIAVQITDAAGTATWHDAGAIPQATVAGADPQTATNTAAIAALQTAVGQHIQVPASTGADDGKVLTVANGVASWQDRVSDLPNTAGQTAGDALTITDPATGAVGWAPPAGPAWLPSAPVVADAGKAMVIDQAGVVQWVTPPTPYDDTALAARVTVLEAPRPRRPSGPAAAAQYQALTKDPNTIYYVTA